MDRSELRSAISANKTFLRELYKCGEKEADSLIKRCSEQELRVLFYVCVFIARGEIPLYKRSARNIGQSNLTLLKQFDGLQFTPEVSSQLLQLTSSFRDLLRPLFEPPPP